MFKVAAKRIVKTLSLPLLGTITNVATDKNIAALTFDDGPDPDSTPVLLEILKKYKVRATFFLIGKAAKRYPNLLHKIAVEGHAIGNHTWSHPQMRMLSKSERIKQIQDCAEAIAPYGTKLFRPPYGDQTIGTRLDALQLGYQVITWNVVAFDWEIHDSTWISGRLIENVKPGSIILLHDSLWNTISKGAEDRTAVFKALDAFLGATCSKYQFLTIPELLRSGHGEKQHWYFFSIER